MTCRETKITFDNSVKFVDSRFEMASLSWSSVKTTLVSASKEIECSVLLTTYNSGPTVSSIT